MPNGGIPIHMAVYPKDGSPFVVYSRGGQLTIYSREVWDKDGIEGKPLCTLTPDEAGALTWFLKYFLPENKVQPGWHMRGTVRADFEF